MTLARRTTQIKPSATMAMAAKAKAMMAQGIDVIDFSLGEPDFPSAEVASEAGVAAIRRGETKYTPASGTGEIKDAILKKLASENGLCYTPKEIIVSCGAKHTLYNIAQALFDPDDEVLIPAPYWVSYPDQVLLTGATPVIVNTREENHFLMTPNELKKAITKRAKAVILNYPSNPTGATYSRKQLMALAEVLLSSGLWIISDEIYEKFTYGAGHVSLASLSPALKAKTLLVNGVSKAYSMTGWRIGYAAGPQEVIEAMGMIQSQCTSNPSSISQVAATAALLHGTSFVKQMVAEFEIRRQVMVEGLNRIPGIKCPLPAGSFYAFPNISGLIGKNHSGGQISCAADLSAFFLEQARVSTVSGEAFGAEGYLRLSYATSQEMIRSGLQRLETAVQQLI